MKRGQITVFLSLLLSIICGLLSIIVESTRVSAMRMQIESGMDLGLHSIFAEFNRSLLSRYDLFYIDTSYKNGSADINRLTGHLHDYLKVNTTTETNGFVRSGDWFQMEAEGTELIQYLLATDYEGKAFRRQALHYINQKGLLARSVDGVQVKNEIGPYESGGSSEKRADAEGRISGIPIPQAISQINSLRGRKTSDLVVGAMSVSKKHMDIHLVPSHRSLRTGIGNVPCHVTISDTQADQLLDRYLFDKCSDYTERKGPSVLDYEIEYIIAGQGSDDQNLEWITSRLLRVREEANITYLFSDEGRKNEAREMAIYLTAGLRIPGLVEAITEALLYAWGYAEAILDVNRLLCGGRVPVMKSSSDWRLPLKELLQFRKYLGEGGGNGYEYRDYLSAYLSELTVEKRMRCLDIIEANIRLMDQNPGFEIDGCVEHIQANAAFNSGYGYNYSVLREYGYEIEK